MENEERKTSLLDVIHRCLACNEMAFEVEKNKYECGDTNCNFTWEVLDCEK